MKGILGKTQTLLSEAWFLPTLLWRRLGPHEEDIVHAMLPGDDPENHPRYTKNLYFNGSYPNLKSLVESCSLPPVEQRLAEEALLWMEGPKPSRPSRG